MNAPDDQQWRGSRRPDPTTAARWFVERRFPDCAAALLGGSVVRGDAGPSSDLDIVVLAANEQPNWSSHVAFGWPIELFVQTPASYPAAFAHDRRHRWPLLPALCAEGLVLVDRSGAAEQLRGDAQHLLAAGPPPLSDDEKAWYRYTLTWMRGDVEDAHDLDEARLMVHDLAVTTAEVHLVLKGRWLGKGKWLLRNLRSADPELAEQFTHAQRAFHVDGNKAPLLRLATATLHLLGGPKFAGRSAFWWGTG